METQRIKVCKSSVVDYDEKGIVTVAANAFSNEDADGDISMPGSYTKTLSENFNRMRWLLNHDRTKLLGVPIEGNQSNEYLKMRGQMNLKKEIARDTYEDYKLYAEYGRSLEHSVMVQAIKRDKGDERKVLEWKMWEYSTLTTWGANEQTPMIDIKASNDLGEAIAFMELCLRKGNYTDDRGKEMEKHIKIMRSLIDSEPDNSTQLVKPDAETINYIKNLKFV